MTHRLAEGAKQDVPLEREAQTARHTRLSELGVPVASRFPRHERKSTLAGLRRQSRVDANTQLIMITIALDSPRVPDATLGVGPAFTSGEFRRRLPAPDSEARYARVQRTQIQGR
jgi:hypothetical protein